MGQFAASLVVSVLPVLAFLGLLLYLDSFKLVGLRAILLGLLAGAACAGAAYLVHREAAALFDLRLATYTRYVAPLAEETLKSAMLVWLLRRGRVGFLVDAAIFGFALGTGFAVVENLYYLRAISGGSWGVWLVRGFGTAIMHGGSTAIFGIVSKLLSERRESIGASVFLPGWLAAVIIHSFFNHFFFTPLLSAMVILLGLPPLLVVVFRSSERSLRGWLGVGFDAHTELLEQIHSGSFSESKIGRYLQSLREHFRGEVVADMLCYLRLHVELALRAKGELMMREAGLRSRLEPDLRAKFEEMKFLEQSIGKTGRLAMAPFLSSGGKDLWQLTLLGGK